MILGGIIAGICIFIIFLISSYYDIIYRKLPKWLMVTIAIFFCFGIALCILRFIYTGNLDSIINLVICMVIYGIITISNGIRLSHGKQMIIGGADIVILLAVCTICPFIWIIPSMLVLVGGGIVLVTFSGFIPKLQEILLKKGVPFIPYMGAVWFICAFMPVLLGL